jgi:endonuclease YncB( thermonuclease family)
LPDGHTGWVTSSDIGDMTEAPSTGTSRAAKTPQRTEEGIVTRVSDVDTVTVTVITSNQTKLCIRMWGIDAPETPKGTKFPGQPYGKEAEAYLKQLVESKRVRVEIDFIKISSVSCLLTNQRVSEGPLPSDEAVTQGAGS